MDYYLGIDGGGSSTKYLLIDGEGTVLERRQGGGSSYRAIGVDGVAAMLKNEADSLFRNFSPADVGGVFFGMPCYGEGGEDEQKEATDAISRRLAPYPVAFRNDVEAAWAGAFGLASNGIILLSGTGSMALGRDCDGKTIRCGGWSEFFSDEGSGYWLGVETLRLFSRQADGRAEKGPLYGVIREHFSLDDDYAVVDIVHERIVGRRDKVAGLQRLLRDAALLGDRACLALYEAAAGELLSLALGLARRYPPGAAIPVSYAGGLFHSGELILKPLRDCMSRHSSLEFVPPLLTPAEGAALLAVEAFAPGEVPRVREGLLRGRS